MIEERLTLRCILDLHVLLLGILCYASTMLLPRLDMGSVWAGSCGQHSVCCG